MADQHHKGRPSRGIAEQPTRPVDIDHLVDAGVPHVDDVEGPTIGGPVDPMTARGYAPDRDPSMTQSGTFGEVETGGAAVSDPRFTAPSGVTTGGYTSADEPTRALPADKLAPRPPPLEPTSSVPWPPQPTAWSAPRPLAPDDMLGARYLIREPISGRGPGRRYLAQMLNEHPVVVRVYAEPDVVRHRPEWQALCEAFQAGATLPDLLQTEGVVPLLDLFEDAKHGPVIVTAALEGGSLAQAVPRLRGPLRGQRLAACFEAVSAVLARAHAQGVAVGRFTLEDILLDRDGVPHLDLSVAAFADALDVRDPAEEALGPPEGGLPSPGGDVWWLGCAIASCLPETALEPGTDILGAVAVDCTEGDPRPTAAEVHRRLRAGRLPIRTAGRRRWPAVGLVALGVVIALGAGWVAGGGLGGLPAVAPSADPPRTTAKALSDGEAAVLRGAYLEAGRLYVERLNRTPDDEVKAAFDRLQRSRAYRRALKTLKKRLANADELNATVRGDIETLRALEPESLVLKHWLGRLAEAEGVGP